MTRHSEVRPYGIYTCRMVPDPNGSYPVAGTNFRVNWIVVPANADSRLMSKIVADCIITGEQFFRDNKDTPREIRASALQYIWSSYSEAQ